MRTISPGRTGRERLATHAALAALCGCLLAVAASCGEDLTLAGKLPATATPKATATPTDEEDSGDEE